MATNPKTSIQVTFEYLVASGDTATEGFLLLMDSDTEVDDAGANSVLGFAVALESKTAAQRVSVAPISGNACIPVKVGTGGATRGKKAAFASDGFTDAPALADGDTVTPTYGSFAESGVAGDMVGMFPGYGFVEST